jgi:hypothetical protein
VYEEMRAREAIKRNVIIHGVKEAESQASDKDRAAFDLEECDRIFGAIKAKARKTDVRFCRRIGERGQMKRPLLLGMKTESIKADLLDAAVRLQYSVYKNVSIGPDQTKKQRKAEGDLNQLVARKNREDLTDQDRTKNLQWMAVGRKGEKRIVKTQVREENGGYTQQEQRNGWRQWRGRWGEEERNSRERGHSPERRNSGEWRNSREQRNSRERRHSREQRNSRERRSSRERRTSRGQRNNKEMVQDREQSRTKDQEQCGEKSKEGPPTPMELGVGDTGSKRGLSSGTESEEEEEREPPRNRSKQ